MLFILYFFFVTTSSFPQDFIAPVYELGSYIPPLPANGDVQPGKPSKLPAIELETRIDGEDKPQVAPAIVLGSNTPISSIQPWKPSQIIPPDNPQVGATADKTTKSPLGPGFIWPAVNNQDNEIHKSTTQSSNPSFNPNPGNKIPISDRIDDNDDKMGENYANNYQNYVLQHQKPLVTLEYQPNRPFYAGSPKTK